MVVDCTTFNDRNKIKENRIVKYRKGRLYDYID